MHTIPDRSGLPGHPPRRLQFGLGSLLVAATLVAAICSVGMYVGPGVAGAVLATVAVGTIVACGLGRTRRAFAQGALFGLLFSLAPILATAVNSFFVADGLRSSEAIVRRSPVVPRSAEEILTTIQAAAPSARAISDGVNGGELLSGQYERGMMTFGVDLYLFPDGSYLRLDWADIGPLTIVDQGTWTYQNGFVVLQTDGVLNYDGHEDDVYLPLTHLTDDALTPGNEQPETVLLGVVDDLNGLLKAGVSEDEDLLDFRISLLLGGCCRKTNNVSARGMRSTKETLYEECSPPILQWRRRGLRYAAATAILCVMAVVMQLAVWRNAKREITSP